MSIVVPRRLTGKWRKRAMALPEFTMRQLMEAGVHFGHRDHLWNPKMAQYIYGTRNNIHIMDLGQTAPLLHNALKIISDTVANGGRVLMVGTKRQAQEGIATAARQSAQYFINARWLGGMLTNWKTVSQAIQRLRDLDEILATDTAGYTKKEMLNITRERDKLERNLGGIKDMGGIPNMLFVIDTNKEAIAIKEATKLNIPVAAILDSNSNTDGVTFPIPGNDDAARAINLYCDLISRAAIDGIERAQNQLTTDDEEASRESGSRRTRQRQTKQRTIEKPSDKSSASSIKDADTKTSTDKKQSKKAGLKSDSKTEQVESKAKVAKESAKKTSKGKDSAKSKTTTKPEVKTKRKTRATSATKTETKSTSKTAATKLETKSAVKSKSTTSKATTGTAKPKTTTKTEKKAETKPTTKKTTTTTKTTKPASSKKTSAKSTIASKKEST